MSIRERNIAGGTLHSKMQIKITGREAANNTVFSAVCMPLSSKWAMEKVNLLSNTQNKYDLMGIPES